MSVAPAGPLTLTVGQTQTFTATVSGGTGTKSYQWYLDGAVGFGSDVFNLHLHWGIGFTSVYVRVTDSASTPVSVNSNTVSITASS